MREIRLSGSEGRGEAVLRPYPYLPPPVQVQEYIKALQFLENLLAKGSKVNLIAEPIHTCQGSLKTGQ